MLHNKRRLYFSIAVFLSLFIDALVCPAFAAISDEANAPNSADDLTAFGIETYIFGYPLVTMEMTRRLMTNTTHCAGKYAPMGQFANLQEYPTAADKEVTTPNADTLYCLAWIDVSKEPYVLSIPDAQGRYYLMPMLDGWTNVFASPGTRTTGTKAQKYVITGPNWSGQLPKDIKEYKSPTGLVWILGRVYCTGTMEDYMKAHAFQSDLSLTPLSAYNKTYIPPAGLLDTNQDMTTPVRDQVNQLDAESYFQLLAQLLKTNPPADADKAVVADMAKIGIVPGQDFDINKLTMAAANSLYFVPKAAQDKIMAHMDAAGKLTNGWLTISEIGTYGTNYIQRALITAVGLGANLREDAVYPSSQVDTNGKLYDGTNKYIMHFAKGQMPPVNGFWSLTMYDSKHFFVANPINRYNVSSRSQFKYNGDGSLDIYIQKDSPGKDKEANWLPAAEGKFNLVLRMYWPKPEVLEGKYVIPPVQEVK